MRQLFRPLALLILAMLIPLLPFLGWASEIDAWYQQFVDDPPPPLWTAAFVLVALSTDIFLPVPSSVVSTLAGSQLGIVGATITSFVGMTIGAVVGFAVARWWGRPVAKWFAKEEDLARMEELTAKLGPAVLVITRAVPILAEASVLLVGASRMTWRAFLPPLLLANMGLSLVYAVSGKHLSFLYAMAGAVVLPVAAACVVRWIWPETGVNDTERSDVV